MSTGEYRFRYTSSNTLHVLTEFPRTVTTNRPRFSRVDNNSVVMPTSLFLTSNAIDIIIITARSPRTYHVTGSYKLRLYASV